jgi:hypothetical protein
MYGGGVYLCKHVGSIVCDVTCPSVGGTPTAPARGRGRNRRSFGRAR